MSVLDQGIKKPDGYSADTVDKLVKPQSGASDQKPNVIYLQLESFFDLAPLKDVELSADSMPFFQDVYKRQAYAPIAREYIKLFVGFSSTFSNIFSLMPFFFATKEINSLS